MSYTKRYDQGTEADKDAQAIVDMIDYVGHSRFRDLIKLLADVQIGTALMGLSLVGIQGRPAHAFLRKNRLTDWRAYQKSQGIATDAEGYTL